MAAKTCIDRSNSGEKQGPDETISNNTPMMKRTNRQT